MPTEPDFDVPAASQATHRHEFKPELIAGLALVALSAVFAAAGAAQLLVATEPAATSGAYIVAGGLGALLLSGMWALKIVRTLPDADGDCERYGRHIIGLTFLLLVTGLCNAVGTSILALHGGLGFSSSLLIEASDPKHAQEADRKHEQALDALDKAQRAVFVAERTLKHAGAQLAVACATESEICTSARANRALADDAVEDLKYELRAATERTNKALASCAKTRDDSKRALFFLLSLSAMMSLFGASFYVVNRVRSKRPLLAHSEGSDGESADFERDSELPNLPTRLSTANATLPSGPGSAAIGGNLPADACVRLAQIEPFDVHAFWSGAFFRVGEAVLFTFAFFWLIWTSDRRTSVVWLPVLGLFVGMFVKTGEAIIFRLGMRVLFAVEALLPTAAPAPRGPVAAPERAANEPSGSAGGRTR